MTEDARRIKLYAQLSRLGLGVGQFDTDALMLDCVVTVRLSTSYEGQLRISISLDDEREERRDYVGRVISDYAAAQWRLAARDVIELRDHFGIHARVPGVDVGWIYDEDDVDAIDLFFRDDTMGGVGDRGTISPEDEGGPRRGIDNPLLEEEA
jgi:hypothetical protein